MCQIIPCQVLRVLDGRVEVMFDGEPQVVNAPGITDLSAGDYVAVWAGSVLKRLPTEEAHAILALYRELDEMMAMEMEEASA